MKYSPLPILIAAIVLFVLLLIYIPFSIKFYRRRSIHPIKGRSPRLILLINVCMYIWGASTFILTIFGNHAPCLVGCWGVSPFLFFCLHMFEYRGISLLFDYEITQDINVRKNGYSRNITTTTTPKINWFTAHQHFLQPQYSWKICSFLMLWYFGNSLVFTILSKLSAAPMCASFITGIWFNILFPLCCFINVALIAFVGIRLRHCYRDAFFLKTEFQVVAVSGFLAILGYTAIGIFIAPINGDLIGLQGIITFIALHAFFLTGTVWPLYRSYDVCKQIVRPNENLSAFLAQPGGLQMFFNYLQLEFCSESLTFYIEVLDFQNLSLENPTAIRSRAASIFSTYIDFRAHFPINLPFTVLQQTREQYATLFDHDPLTNTDLNIFDQARDEIYYLMAGDAWARFQQTSEYQNYGSSVELVPMSAASLTRTKSDTETKSATAVQGDQSAIQTLISTHEEQQATEETDVELKEDTGNS